MNNKTNKKSDTKARFLLNDFQSIAYFLSTSPMLGSLSKTDLAYGQSGITFTSFHEQKPPKHQVIGDLRLVPR